MTTKKMAALGCAVTALAACETMPDPSDTDPPVVVFFESEGGLTMIGSTRPSDTPEPNPCPPGTSFGGIGWTGPYHIIDSYPFAGLVSFQDDSGIKTAAVSVPNATISDITPTDATLTEGVGGGGVHPPNSAYDRIEVDNTGETPRTPQLVGFTLQPDGDTYQNLYFARATDYNDNAGGGLGIVIATAAEACQ